MKPLVIIEAFEKILNFSITNQFLYIVFKPHNFHDQNNNNNNNNG